MLPTTYFRPDSLKRYNSLYTPLLQAGVPDSGLFAWQQQFLFCSRDFQNRARFPKSRVFCRVKRPARLRNRGYFSPITGIAGPAVTALPAHPRQRICQTDTSLV